MPAAGQRCSLALTLSPRHFSILFSRFLVSSTENGYSKIWWECAERRLWNRLRHCCHYHCRCCYCCEAPSHCAMHMKRWDNGEHTSADEFLSTCVLLPFFFSIPLLLTLFPIPSVSSMWRAIVLVFYYVCVCTDMRWYVFQHIRLEWIERIHQCSFATVFQWRVFFPLISASTSSVCVWLCECEKRHSYHLGIPSTSSSSLSPYFFFSSCYAAIRLSPSRHTHTQTLFFFGECALFSDMSHTNRNQSCHRMTEWHLSMSPCFEFNFLECDSMSGETRITFTSRTAYTMWIGRCRWHHILVLHMAPTHLFWNQNWCRRCCCCCCRCCLFRIFHSFWTIEIGRNLSRRQLSMGFFIYVQIHIHIHRSIVNYNNETVNCRIDSRNTHKKSWCARQISCKKFPTEPNEKKKEQQPTTKRSN